MFSDPIADMLTRIKNGYLTGKITVEIPHSKIKENLASLIVKEGYALKYEVEKDSPVESGRKRPKIIKLTLKYNKKNPAIEGIKRVSKPGLRIYKGKQHLPKVLGGIGIAIISTPHGLMIEKEAKKLGLGGEVICKIW